MAPVASGPETPGLHSAGRAHHGGRETRRGMLFRYWFLHFTDKVGRNAAIGPSARRAVPTSAVRTAMVPNSSLKSIPIITLRYVLYVFAPIRSA
jgi:hypothetical protein